MRHLVVLGRNLGHEAIEVGDSYTIEGRSVEVVLQLFNGIGESLKKCKVRGSRLEYETHLVSGIYTDRRQVLHQEVGSPRKSGKHGG